MKTIVIQGGRLLDGTGRATVENASVVVEGAKITSVGPAGEVPIPSGEGVEIVDITGKTVMPGLIDSHVHIYSNGESSESTSMPIRDNPLSRAMMAVPRLKRTLEMGITTLRGMAGRGGGGWR